MQQEANSPRHARPEEERRIRRLRYRAWRRGTKEADLLLGRFADANAAQLGLADLDRFEALLEEPDDEVYAWITGREPCPARHDHELFAQIRAFALSASARDPEPSP